MKICMHMEKVNGKTNYAIITEKFAILLQSSLYVHQSPKISISCRKASLSLEKAPVVRARSTNLSFIMALTRPSSKENCEKHTENTAKCGKKLLKNLSHGHEKGE